VQQRFLEEDYIIETLTLARQPNVLWLAMGDVETQDVGEYHG
jgi:predicted nuclease of predicted toxin-antitoxin system